MLIVWSDFRAKWWDTEACRGNSDAEIVYRRVLYRRGYRVVFPLMCFLAVYWRVLYVSGLIGVFPLTSVFIVFFIGVVSSVLSATVSIDVFPLMCTLSTCFIGLVIGLVIGLFIVCFHRVRTGLLIGVVSSCVLSDCWSECFIDDCFHRRPFYWRVFIVCFIDVCLSAFFIMCFIDEGPYQVNNCYCPQLEYVN